MSCRQCDEWVSDYGFCRINASKPLPTGNPRNCPYYTRKKDKDY